MPSRTIIESTVCRVAGELTPAQRLLELCDEGSFELVDPNAPFSPTGDCNVIVGAGAVGGRPVYCYAQDYSNGAGALGERQGSAVLRAMRLAGQARVPIIGFIDSAGARIQEGTRALAAYGRIFRENVELSGRVPQISVVTGLAAGGACYGPALTDIVVMTSTASMFLTGPSVVEQAIRERVTARELGGARVQERNGVCDVMTSDDASAIRVVRKLLSFLPQSFGKPQSRICPGAVHWEDPGRCVPREPSRVYDVREVITRIVDVDSFLELSPRWAKNLVTGFARLEGWAVGVIANQPRHMGGIIDVEASQKGARFVQRCASFGLPLVALVDTPGFMPGSRQEANAIIRHGAAFLRAFAEAKVAKATVVLRKAYGGALITMSSKALGADIVLAWPHATLGILGAYTAVGIVDRREIAAARDPSAEHLRRAALYAAEHESSHAAARLGIVDEVISPSVTRVRVARTLEALASADG